MGWDKPQPLQVYSAPDDSLMWVDLEQEANRATEMLKGKIVAQVWRHQKQRWALSLLMVLVCSLIVMPMD